MDNPRIYADFNNADAQGRLRLNCNGTLEDLSVQQLTLRERQWLTLYDEDLEVEGQVAFSPEENVWVALIDWAALKRQQHRVAQVEYATR